MAEQEGTPTLVVVAARSPEPAAKEIRRVGIVPRHDHPPEPPRRIAVSTIVEEPAPITMVVAVRYDEPDK